MTDRINALTVILDRDIREDDVEPLTDAIRMFRGVLSVETHVADLSDVIAERRARAAIAGRIYSALEATR